MIVSNVKIRQPKVLFIKTRTKGTEGNISIEYYITEKFEFDFEVDLDLDNVMLYGIEVRKICLNNESNLSGNLFNEISTCYNVSTNKAIVEDLIHILADNEVTPVTLKYNLEDMCGTYF